MTVLVTDRIFADFRKNALAAGQQEALEGSLFLASIGMPDSDTLAEIDRFQNSGISP